MTTSLRVAVVGSGPAGFYATAHLLKLTDLTVSVDMFDRLPTPFGLVRAGVAPDHPKIKSVTRVFDKTATDPRFRFFGHVEIGRDVSVDELATAYDAVIYAQGADRGKRAGIPGEQLAGNYSANAIVGWYNGHPDYRGLEIDMSGSRAVVIGTGNVALDVARMLALPPAALAATDIAEHALESLRHSNIDEIVVLGRRGPEQAAFTEPELEELGQLIGVDVVVDPDDLPISQRDDPRGRLAMLAEYATRKPTPGNKRIVLKFHTRPVEAVGESAVATLRVERQGEIFELAASLVVHAVGYVGSPLHGVPFDAERGIICNDGGRVTGQPGIYVAGWIKRGPTGVIGTNKACAHQTVDALASDARAGLLPVGSPIGRDALQRRLSEGCATDFAGWRAIDEHERNRGQLHGRPRIKVTRVSELVDIAGTASR
ncbi:NADPH-ferredoxin reductase fprA [Mycobacteroides abscessus subsp. abscessus]|nr:NADPH-ferredoxin reductase fprA [Mycobacteroides abscessus subsp. abscessus]